MLTDKTLAMRNTLLPFIVAIFNSSDRDHFRLERRPQFCKGNTIAAVSARRRKTQKSAYISRPLTLALRTHG